MKETITTKSEVAILSIKDTSRFIEYLDLALKSANSIMLKLVFEKFSLISHPETKDFLALGKFIFKKYDNYDENIQIIKVEARSTYCVACSFGKTVKAYDVEYIKEDSNIFVVYNSSFAVNLDIFRGELIEFSWCNAFLSEVEVENLRKFK